MKQILGVSLQGVVARGRSANEVLSRVACSPLQSCVWEMKQENSNLSALNIWLHVVKIPKPQRKSLMFLFFLSSIPTYSLFGQTIKYSKDMTASSVSSCFIDKTSQGYTRCAYVSKHSELALIYHHKQAEYSCDRFVIFPPFAFPYVQRSSHRRFTLRARNELFFFLPSHLSLSLVMSQLG